MKIKHLFSLVTLSLMAAATFTSCEDILGEWSRPAPATPVTPAKVAVIGITLDAEAVINLGETKTLTATVAPDNATDKTVSWSSEDETIASVNASTGEVTGVAVGTTTITATANDGSGVKATYWSSSSYEGLAWTATIVDFPMMGLTISNGSRSTGLSVRLVRDVTE